MLLFSVLGLLVIPSVASPFPDKSQQLPKRDVQFRVQKSRANAVKEAFQFAWDGYYTYAFPADELNPITRDKGYSRFVQGAGTLGATNTDLWVLEMDGAQLL
jgi:mannosyl-oligosaccharide alpha-1,2-mannosidase